MRISILNRILHFSLLHRATYKKKKKKKKNVEPNIKSRGKILFLARVYLENSDDEKLEKTD